MSSELSALTMFSVRQKALALKWRFLPLAILPSVLREHPFLKRCGDDELLSAGMMAVCRCTQKWRPGTTSKRTGKLVGFNDYAGKAVRRAMIYCGWQLNPVWVPPQAAKALKRKGLRQKPRRVCRAGRRRPTGSLAEIAGRLSLRGRAPVDTVAVARGLSVSEPVSDTVAAHPQRLDPLDWHEVLDTLPHLPEREARAIRLRYLDDLQLPQVAQALGLASKQRAKQIIDDGLTRLRRRLAA